LGRLALQDIAEEKQMTKTIALIMKEWHDLRWFLVAGLAFFLCLPLPIVINNLRYNNSLTDAILFELPVLAFGGMFALIVAIGVLCHDFKGNTFYFWTSRPIGLKSFLLIKYLAGLSVVLCVCIVPLVLNLLIYHLSNTRVQVYTTNTFDVLSCHSFTILLLFSVTFLISTLVRQAANTALLSLSAALLVYFVPTLFSSLESVSIFYYLSEGVFDHIIRSSYNGGPVLVLSQGYTQFVAVMLGLSLACLIMSWLVLERNWRISISRHAMPWCLGLVVLLLAGSCAFQIGSNMNCERQIPIPSVKTGLERGAARIASAQNSGVVLLYDHKPNWIAASANYSVSHFDLSLPEAGIGSGYTTHTGGWPSYSVPEYDQLLWSPQHPTRAYLLPKHKQAGAGVASIPDAELWTLALDAADANAIRHKLKLNDPSTDSNPNATTNLHLHENTIYAYVGRLLCIDISHPDNPTLKQTIAVDRSGIYTDKDDSYIGLRTLPLPDMSNGERFDISFHLAPGNDKLAYVDDLLVAATRQGISTYRIVDLDKELVRFELLGHVRVSPLQRLAGFYSLQLMIHGDFAYVLNDETGIGGGMIAFDIRDPEHPRQAGHYAAPGERFLSMAPLPGGDILVGGNNLHIVNPPKR
jgi:ABC-type transport system involved in multi-copper enzyme maturation permease subunit